MNLDRKNIINVITSPLGFFVLALLIVEGFLGIILVFSKEQDLKFHFWGMVIGAFLFVLVVILVWIIVWKKPRNLTLEGKHHFEMAKMEKQIDYNESPKSATEKDISKKINKYIKIYE